MLNSALTFAYGLRHCCFTSPSSAASGNRELLLPRNADVLPPSPFRVGSGAGCYQIHGLSCYFTRFQQQYVSRALHAVNVSSPDRTTLPRAVINQIAELQVKLGIAEPRFLAPRKLKGDPSADEIPETEEPYAHRRFGRIWSYISRLFHNISPYWSLLPVCIGGGSVGYMMNNQTTFNRLSLIHI